jgi:hypothetical protein
VQGTRTYHEFKLLTLGLAVFTILGKTSQQTFDIIQLKFLASRIWGFDRHVWDLTPELAIQSRKVESQTALMHQC